jgi:serine/threonine protein kinase
MSTRSFQDYAPGTVIPRGEGTLVVGERLSRGGFGSVYACADEWGSPLRLRVLWPISRSYENVREGWLEQVEEVRRAGHPRLVHLYEGFDHNGFFHLVTERWEHRLDSGVLEAGEGGPRWLGLIAGPVLCALDHLHRAGYPHFNLHPGNVFLTASPGALAAGEGAVKLGGFAVSRLLGKVDVLNLLVSRWLVPPEYLIPSELGRQMDHRVDIYQAGLLLLALLQGSLPRYTFEETVAGEPGRAARELGSPALAWALAPKVEDRCGSARELWRALAGEGVVSAAAVA